jgi:alkanesulfonate monooxygenase SsuD/methylene tetrahydromethanopterin reductase-like flavin-dependent oxidoreductase (luciferase family)
VRLGFTPVRDQIPIWLGSVMPKGVALAGQIADGWVPFLMPRMALNEQVGIVRAAAAERTDGGPRVVPIVPMASRAEQIDQLRQVIAIYVGPTNSPYAKMLKATGYDKEVDVIVSAYDSAGGAAAAAAVPDQLLDAVGLVGPLDTAGHQVETMAAAGADTVMIWPLALTVESCRQLFEAIGR